MKFTKSYPTLESIYKKGLMVVVGYRANFVKTKGQVTVVRRRWLNKG